MKIAILGKGGSGKSTVSWILSNYLASINQQVLAIDADHNMDLVSCLGVNEIPHEKSFHRSIEEVRKILGLEAKEHWSLQFNDNKGSTWEGSYHPADEFLYKYLIPVSDKIDLLSLGLGDEDVMYIGKCAHGLSAPLKFYLPRLKLSPNSYAIIDSVAGADMVNYGLFFGCDIVCAVVENYTNSIRVAKQLQHLFQAQGITLKFIINKSNGNDELLQDFIEQNAQDILGRIPLDPSITQYNFDQLSPRTIEQLEHLYQTISKQPKNSTGLEDLKNFELQRRANQIAAA